MASSSPTFTEDNEIDVEVTRLKALATDTTSIHLDTALIYEPTTPINCGTENCPNVGLSQTTERLQLMSLQCNGEFRNFEQCAPVSFDGL